MAEEKKEWLVGAPEYKDRSFTVSEVRDLVKSGKLLGTDLVLRIGDVWKSAQDYPDLASVLGPAPASAAPRPAIIVRPSRPPQQRTTQTKLPVKAAAPPPPPPPHPRPPSVPKIVIRPPAPPPPPTPSPEPEPEAPAPSKDETDLDVPVPAPTADEATPSSAPSDEDTDVQAPAVEEKRPGRRGRTGRQAFAPPPPEFVALEIETFTTDEMLRRVKNIFHPLKLLTCLLMVLVAFATGGLIAGGKSDFTLVVAAWIFFACFGVFHGIASLMTRFEIEGARGFHLLVPFLKRGLTLAINAGMALLFLGTLALPAVVAYDLEKGMSTLVLSLTGFAFVLMSILFTMTGGYLNAILAVEVCGVGKAFSRLLEIYRLGFRRVLAHTCVMVVFSYALFLIFFMPVMAHGVLWMSDAKFQPPAPFIFLLFGFATAFAVSALGTLNVYSYLWITKNVKGESEQAGSGTGETEAHAPVEPSTENEDPTEATPAASAEGDGGETREPEPVEPSSDPDSDPSSNR